MSAIGEYIHLTAAGYEKHGVTKDGAYSSPLLNLDFVRKEIQGKIKKNSLKMTDEEKREIESTIYNFMLTPETDSAQIAKAKKALQDDLMKHFKELMTQGKFDAAAAKMEGVSTDKKLGMVSAHRSENKKSLYLDLAEITKKIDTLEKEYLSEISKNKKNLDLLKKLKQNYKKIIGESVKKLASYDFKKNEKGLNLQVEGSYTEIGELRNAINTLIQEYAAYPDIVGVEGLGFEDTIALAITACQDEARENFEEVFVKNVKGAEVKKNASQYDNSRFSQQIVQLGEGTFLKNTYNKRSKVDVEIDWEGKNLKISAKNIKVNDKHSWVTVVDGTPLMFLIQDMPINFVNHFINLHATHPDSFAKGNTQTNKDKVDDIMKEYILYKGITGDTYGTNIQDQANLMIINDKTSKYGVRVFDINDIYQDVMGKVKKIKTDVDGRNIRKLSLPNEYIKNDPSGSRRTLRILNALHEAKVKAGFNAAEIITKK